MRLGARLDEVIASIARGEQPLLKKAITEVYNEAYSEGYDDGKKDGNDEGYAQCERDREERDE